jgi:F-type H+-transporting ATPase subunit epsilon
VTVLADTAIRGKDLDEAMANEARRAAEQAVQTARSDIDLAKAQDELIMAAAQYAALRKYRKK